MPGTKTSAPSHVRCSCALGEGHVKCPCLLCPWNNVPYLRLTPRLCRLFIQTFSMFCKSNNLKYLLSLVPGKQRFGTYRFLPIFFCIGGVMEWIMINVRIGRETFCKCNVRNLSVSSKVTLGFNSISS